MISEKDVKRIANLARISLTPAEIKRYQKELSSILGYIGKLKRADIMKADVTTHPRGVVNVLREDEILEGKSEAVARLIQAAPNKVKGFIKVKSVLK